jgi:hypothetical protein
VAPWLPVRIASVDRCLLGTSFNQRPDESLNFRKLKGFGHQQIGHSVHKFLGFRIHCIPSHEENPSGQFKVKINNPAVQILAG